MTLHQTLSALAVACAAWLAAAPAIAQTAAPSAAKKELAARIVKLQQPAVEAMARGLVEQPALQLLQQAGPMMQRVPEAQRESVAKEIQADVRKYAEEAVPLVQARAVRLAPTTIGALLEERFTEDELKQLAALLESPLNRKYQGMAGEMQRSLTEKLVAEARGEIEPKVRALEQTVARRLGVTPASAASAPGKPAAKK